MRSDIDDIDYINIVQEPPAETDANNNDYVLIPCVLQVTGVITPVTGTTYDSLGELLYDTGGTIAGILITRKTEGTFAAIWLSPPIAAIAPPKIFYDGKNRIWSKDLKTLMEIFSIPENEIPSIINENGISTGWAAIKHQEWNDYREKTIEKYLEEQEHSFLSKIIAKIDSKIRAYRQMFTESEIVSIVTFSLVSIMLQMSAMTSTTKENWGTSLGVFMALTFGALWCVLYNALLKTQRRSRIDNKPFREILSYYRTPLYYYLIGMLVFTSLPLIAQGWWIPFAAPIIGIIYKLLINCLFIFTIAYTRSTTLDIQGPLIGYNIYNTEVSLNAFTKIFYKLRKKSLHRTYRILYSTN